MCNSLESEVDSTECNMEEGISEYLSELKGEDDLVELEKNFEIGDEGEEGDVEDEDSDVESASICTARTESLSPRSPSFSTIRRISNPSFLVDDAAQIQSLSQNFINPFVFTSPSVRTQYDRNLYSTPTPTSRIESRRPLPLLPLSVQ